MKFSMSTAFLSKTELINFQKPRPGKEVPGVKLFQESKFIGISVEQLKRSLSMTLIWLTLFWSN